MPTIKDKLHFNFNGVWSDTYGVINVVLDNGMYEESIVANRVINETRVKGARRPLLHDIEDEPLEFEMVIAFENSFTDLVIDGVINWLFVDNYKPLYFLEKEDKIYNCMPFDKPSIVHNGMNQGYIVVQMRCDSPYVYSPLILTNNETVVGTKTITIENDGSFEIYPEISILKNGAGTITIENIDDGGNIFEIRDLTNLEDIYVECEKERIDTDIIGVTRYDNIIGHFPRLIRGTNRIKVTGNCEIQFRYTKIYRF